MASLDMSLRVHVSRSLRPAAVEHLWGPQPSRLTLLEGKVNWKHSLTYISDIMPNNAIS
jgi:hypothetical protein